MVGKTLGHYRILERIGSGGMGEVYRAHDDSLDRDVALKVLAAGSTRDATARARLLREARSAAALNHPDICTVHEVGEIDGQAFIAMELVEGEALSARLAHGALPAEQVRRYGLRLAAALGHAHERGLIHRDLKSANIVITTDGRAKVLDFGLAKRMSEGELDEVTRSQASLTTVGALVGTLAYMAPEQLRGQTADARSDVWALGVVLYEMATGERPFEGRTGFELSSRVLNQPLPPLPTTVPLKLRAVIERCLEKEPGERYQRGGEVRAALETAQADAMPSWTAWRYALARKRGLVLATAGAALVAAFAGLNIGDVRTRLFGGRSAPRIESLAVLPLENLSGDPGQEYFADGMTESLIIDLARLGGLKRVIARGSVARYKGTKRSIPEIGRELNVDALMTGTVLRSGDRVRITAQLINAKTEDPMWSESYERDLRDVMTLQSEVSRAITERIRLRLTPEEKVRLASARRVNPEAYEAYLKGRFYIYKLTPESFQTAQEYFELARQKDPNYALAHAGIGFTWLARAHMGFLPPREALPEAKAPILKAMELDDSLAEVHFFYGSVKQYLEWDWPTAEKEFRRSIELNPNLSEAHQSYADFLLLSGRRAEATKELNRCLELDPLNFWTQAAVGGRYLRLGLYDDGIALLHKALSTEPSLGLAHRYLWAARHLKGMDKEAVDEAKRFFELAGYSEVVEVLARGYAEGGYAEAMRRGAGKLAERSKLKYVQPTHIAALYAYAGDKDRAFEWLERAYEGRDTWMVFLIDDPRFENLRSDPRFRSLLQRMNIAK